MCLLIKAVNICILIGLVQGAQKKWPSKFPTCSRDDPNLNSCMLEATTTMKPYLKAGIPELNIAPISPFKIPEVTIDQGSNSISFKFLLQNLVLTGLDTYEFDKFTFNPEKLHFEASLGLGDIRMKSNYAMSGKILTVPIDGSGTLSNLISGSHGTLEQDAKLITKRGVKFLRLETPIIRITVGEIKNYTYDGLFGGNEIVDRAARKVIDENSNEIVKEIKPAVEKIIESIVLDLEKKTIGTIPYDELFPLSGSG